jgi:hypothetical protein
MATATRTGRITWNRFERDFTLIKNPLVKDASFDGCQFETYGKELDFVKTIPDDRILTIVTSDTGDKLVITPGFHFVNRMGYLITDKPVEYDFWISY